MHSPLDETAPKKLAIYGSTGSIGTQTLEVLKLFPRKFHVVGLTALKNESLLKKQIKQCTKWNEKIAPQFSLGKDPDLSLMDEADIVINALPGFDGLRVSVAALQKGKVLLSANKESLAIAGKELRKLAHENGATIYPLDSEASAIWQLMHEQGLEWTKWTANHFNPNRSVRPEEAAKEIESITLTCSGGPFFGKTAEDLKDVTVKEALNHPTWKMGPKVSLDSATLMNKVLEVFEVHNLFDIPLPSIKITIHRQSHAHSMIHMKSGATKMHISQNDMKLFISYALHYPSQPLWPDGIQRVKKSDLTFEEPDAQTFRPLQWLHYHRGNPNLPIVLNAMNDEASKRFLSGNLRFLEIYDFIELGLDKWLYEKPPTNLDELIAFHEEVATWAQGLSLS